MLRRDYQDFKKLSELHERGILQTVSPDVENNYPLMRNSIDGKFLISNDNSTRRINLHTSMSVSPDSINITPSNIVKSSFGNKKKKLNFTTKFGNKGMKYFPINSSLSKKLKKPIEVKGKSSRTKVSSGSISRSSGKDLNRINSILLKLQEVTKMKDNLMAHNQTLKFRVAELQKEKYSLSQLNKKLNDQVRRRQENEVVTMTK